MGLQLIHDSGLGFWRDDYEVDFSFKANTGISISGKWLVKPLESEGCQRRIYVNWTAESNSRQHQQIPVTVVKVMVENQKDAGMLSWEAIPVMGLVSSLFLAGSS